jgi:hypothetical protein
LPKTTGMQAIAFAECHLPVFWSLYSVCETCCSPPNICSSLPKRGEKRDRLPLGRHLPVTASECSPVFFNDIKGLAPASRPSDLYPQPHPRAGYVTFGYRQSGTTTTARRQAIRTHSATAGRSKTGHTHMANFVAATVFGQSTRWAKHTRSRAPSLAALLVITWRLRLVTVMAGSGALLLKQSFELV